MKSIKVHNHTPSSRREHLPEHEHAARRARANRGPRRTCSLGWKSLGLPRKTKSTSTTPKPGVFLTHQLSQPEVDSLG
jgi:hypothetical protein